MSQVPAFCSNCGSIFPSKLLSFVNSTNITIKGCEEPCINCGSIAKVPDGVYNFIGETIELLSGSESTVQQLNRLAEILNSFKDRDSTYEEVMEEVEQETPQMSSLLEKILPKTKDHLYGFISIIIGIISLLNAMSTDDQKVEYKQHVEVNQVVNYIYENNKSVETPVNDKPATHNFPPGNMKTDYERKRPRVSKPIKPKSSTIIIKNKIGRNDPCYCNSGKKYKRCHGQ